jgi:hypothetical protein
MIRVTFFRHTLVIYIETIMTLTTMGDNSFKPYFNDNIVFNPDEGCSVNYIRLGFHNYTNTKTYKFMFHIIHSI